MIIFNENQKSSKIGEKVVDDEDILKNDFAKIRGNRQGSINSSKSMMNLSANQYNSEKKFSIASSTNKTVKKYI